MGGSWLLEQLFAGAFYLNDKSKYVLPVLLRDIINGQTIAQMTGESTGSSTESVIAATTIMAVLPILIVYPFTKVLCTGDPDWFGQSLRSA